ncbi:beta-propeller domain-containing protein [uncultured Nocardioides sp.]|uniref:Beta propeller domain-containing protein n=1 Tax=uncultured Nocardioides sp. TaxID=198441 RepID=A0A6J4P7J5_9ACTN|nr:beta-propeller domain-containing protein [uncultured Nocardioides sp.]CAA9406602.1 MAG: hypothetical protein AVDCRST_MAG06-2572 [uncultured Nocardioides sp.]
MTAAAAAAALATAFGAGIAFAGDDGVATPPDRWDLPGRLVGADLVAATSCEELLDSYVRRAIDLVGPWGWGGGDLGYLEAARSDAGASASEPAESPATTRATDGGTGTNVQEEGVDEPDVVKTDGDTLFRIDDDELTTYDVGGSEVRELAALDLGGISDGEILLVGDRVVAVGANLPRRSDDTRLVVVDVGDPATPVVTGAWTYDAALVTARLHGDVVRLVLGGGLPELDFVTPDDHRGADTARSENEAVVRATSLDDWLPHVVEVGDDDTVDPAGGDLLADCGDVTVPADDEAALGTTAVVALDPGDAGERGVTAVATQAQTAYFSDDRLYLAAGAGRAREWCCVGTRVRPFGPGAGDDGTTDLHAFALDGADTAHVASGEVEGAVRDRWAMDSAGGVLRLALSPTQATDSASSVVTLREQGDELVEAGRLDGLGPGEDIRSVRWFEDLAIVVTFRQVDPLYAVDLTDVAEPTSVGVLKIPGYSEYLHPLGSDRMIGIGQDATLDGQVRGAQAALFDVTDLTEPRRLDTVEYPLGSLAGAATDPRQFTWLPERRTALTVVSDGRDGRTGWVSVLRLEDGRMVGELLPVERGEEVAQVRLVPLPSGAVVLVTGDDVSLLDL